jgi:hypothetical protein
MNKGSPNPVSVSPSGGDGAMDGAATTALRHRRRGGVLPRKTPLSNSGRMPDFDTPNPVDSSPSEGGGGRGRNESALLRGAVERMCQRP